MAYKTIATVVRNAPDDIAHLNAARDVAQIWGAHLQVLALGTDEIQPGAFYAGAGAIAMRNGMDDAIADAKAIREAATEHLAQSSTTWEVNAAVAQMGAYGHIIAQHVALADLVVLPKPYGKTRHGEDVAVTEAALFSTRTPLLILPGECAVPDRPKHIVLAWNQSTEALAATRAAIPLMQQADSVSIAVIDPPEHRDDQTDPGSLLAEVLSRHGIDCEIAVLAKTMPRISDVIKRHASDTNADLIIMGAYGHSRMREAILGGATRNMLEHTDVPVLMAH